MAVIAVDRTPRRRRRPGGDAGLHALILSRRRATIASVVNRLNGLVTLAGLLAIPLLRVAAKRREP